MTPVELAAEAPTQKTGYLCQKANHSPLTSESEALALALALALTAELETQAAAVVLFAP